MQYIWKSCLDLWKYFKNYKFAYYKYCVYSQILDNCNALHLEILFGFTKVL